MPQTDAVVGEQDVTSQETSTKLLTVVLAMSRNQDTDEGGKRSTFMQGRNTYRLLARKFL